MHPEGKNSYWKELQNLGTMASELRQLESGVNRPTGMDQSEAFPFSPFFVCGSACREVVSYQSDDGWHFSNCKPLVEKLNKGEFFD